MNELLALFSEQLVAQSGWEAIAVVLALAYVWLAARQNIWCWPCALISTGIYVWLFWEVSLPFNSMLNAYYLIMAVYGWLKWKRIDQAGQSVVRWAARRHILAIVLLTVAGGLLGQLSLTVVSGDYVYLDALVTVFSLFTTLLVAHKVLENWLYWVFINGVAAYLYFVSGLVLTSVLFSLYAVFSVYGYFKWKGDVLAPVTVSN